MVWLWNSVPRASHDCSPVNINALAAAQNVVAQSVQSASSDSNSQPSAASLHYSNTSPFYRCRKTACMLMTLCTLCCSGCGVAVRTISESIQTVSNALKEGRRGTLTQEEQYWAKVAWKYFDNNLNRSTGLVNMKDGFQLATMASTGDYLIALLAARDFELISRHEFDARMTALIGFLNNMPLAGGQLPNVNYSANNGWMTNYANQQGELGWSAMDIGRLLVALRIARNRHAEYGEYIDRIVLRWTFCNIIDTSGNLYGAVKIGDRFEKYLDGKHGMREYAARGFQAWGFKTRKASQLDPVDQIRIYGIDLYFDGYDERAAGGNNALITTPFLYDGLEFGWESINSITIDRRYATQAQNVYRVQEMRFQREDIHTARTSHLLNREPYLIYDAIFSNGNKWNTVSEDGTYYPQLAGVSIKAVFGMWALWKTDYTDKLMNVVSTLFDPERGWFEARLEKSGEVQRVITCATNALVLESLWFKQQGRIYQPNSKEDFFYTIYLRDEFRNLSKCFPVKNDD